MCEQNLDLGNVPQLKIDIPDFEEWFEKNAKRIIQDTTEPYKKRVKTRTNPKLWITYLSLKAGGTSHFQAALRSHTWGIQKNYSLGALNQFTQIKEGDLVAFIGPGKSFPGRINLKA